MNRLDLNLQITHWPNSLIYFEGCTSFILLWSTQQAELHNSGQEYNTGARPL